MDPFWAITLSTIAIARFWKREKRLNAEKKYQKEKATAVFPEKSSAQIILMTPEEREAEKKREQERAELRKRGFTDELIAVMIPTINNGQ